MTHCAHMVVVFHLCVSVGTLRTSAFDDMKLVFAQSKKVSQSNVTNIFSVSLSPKLSQEEIERRRVRRERNKLAAAKCRNRRRELTDTLQNVIEHYTNVTVLRLEIQALISGLNLTICPSFLCPPPLPWCRRPTSWRMRSPVCRRK